MSPPLRIEFEDIEAMRQQAGIDDAELREKVRALRVGDSVSLTARVGGQALPGDLLLVRILGVRGGSFRGELARRPASRRSPLEIGAVLTFRARHIHSVRCGSAVIPAGGRGATRQRARQPSRAEPESEGTERTMRTPPLKPTLGGPLPPLLSTEQRLREVGEMLKRVNEYTEFMCGSAGRAATSHEAREQAVAAFHERMAVLERQLARIHDEFRLG